MEFEQILFDPKDLDAMKNIMDNYCDDNIMRSGVNELGEEIWASIYKDRIVIVTYQSNGWVRESTYWRDGTCDEVFQGREEPYEV